MRRFRRAAERTAKAIALRTAVPKTNLVQRDSFCRESAIKIFARFARALDGFRSAGCCSNVLKKRNEHASRLRQTTQAQLTRVRGVSSQSSDQKRRFLS
jgi:hypothetical protein